MTEPAPTLTVVIPALNERRNLERLMPALRDELAGLGVPAEIIVVDGGSTDGTQTAAARHGARVVRQLEPGYGGALVAGFAATQADWIVTMDADLSHRPVFLREFWKRREEVDVAIASRWMPGGHADMSRFRRLLSLVLNRIYARVLALPIRDLSSGFRMYRRAVLAGVTLEARDFDILEELLIRIHAAGWRIEEVPFHYAARGSGRSHARVLRLGWAFTRTLARMWQLRNSVQAADYDWRAYASPIWLQRYWQRARYRIVLGYLHPRVPGMTVDVGCGSSRIIVDLPEAVAVDILPSRLRWLRARHPRLLCASGDRLPLADASVAAMIHSEVLEHVTNPADHLAEAARVLRPGGTLVVGTPDYGRPLWPILEWIYGKVLPGAYAHEHVTHLTRDELERRLDAHAFDVLDLRYVGFCEMIFKARRRP